MSGSPEPRCFYVFSGARSVTRECSPTLILSEPFGVIHRIARRCGPNSGILGLASFNLAKELSTSCAMDRCGHAFGHWLVSSQPVDVPSAPARPPGPAYYGMASDNGY